MVGYRLRNVLMSVEKVRERPEREIKRERERERQIEIEMSKSTTSISAKSHLHILDGVVDELLEPREFGTLRDGHGDGEFGHDVLRRVEYDPMMDGEQDDATTTAGDAWHGMAWYGTAWTECVSPSPSISPIPPIASTTYTSL